MREKESHRSSSLSPSCPQKENSGLERSKDLPKITQGVAWVSWAHSSPVERGASVGRPSDSLIVSPAPLPKMKGTFPAFDGSLS